MDIPFATWTLLSQSGASTARDKAARLLEMLGRRPTMLAEEVPGALQISRAEGEALVTDLKNAGRLEVRNIRGGAKAISVPLPSPSSQSRF